MTRGDAAHGAGDRLDCRRCQGESENLMATLKYGLTLMSRYFHVTR
ncbi:hypothetical protein PA08_2062 [Cutibacterium modestum P08]|nr:hypothetical protein PA08_2062 [Cutibacterium modestum P08]